MTLIRMTLNSYFTLNSGYSDGVKDFTRLLTDRVGRATVCMPEFAA